MYFNGFMRGKKSRERYRLVFQSSKVQSTFEMENREVQKFLDSLLTNDGLIPNLEVVEMVNSVKVFTDRGRIVAQCTERNDVHLHASPVFRAASRPCLHLLADTVRTAESDNIPIRTCRNRPVEGEDHTLAGC